MGLLDNFGSKVGTYLGDKENRLNLASGFASMSGNPNTASIMAGIQDQKKVLAARREKANASDALKSQTAMAVSMLDKFPMLKQAVQAGIISPNEGIIAARKGSDARVVGSSLVAMDGTVLYTDANKNDGETTALQTLKGRAKAAGLEEGTDAYRQFMLSAGKQNGLSLTVGPDGTVTLNQGGTGAASKPLSGNEGKATGFFMRANASNKVITELEETGTEFGQWVLGKIPLTNWARSPDFQRLDAAKRDWISAVLRLESGAAIAASEFDNYDKAYFPQVGDSAAVLSQKRTTRNLIAQTLKVQAGKGVSQTPVSTSSSSPTVKVYDAQGNLISG
tara:strand:+ start:39 stop:1043 length:1005 start_codon:yes stop_codon:yes gene_type:complete